MTNMTKQTQVRSTVEAMKLALEALENAWLDASMGKGDVARHTEAITVLREALAQERSSDEQPAQPQQEPVALQIDVIVGNLVRENINKHRARELAEHFIKHSSPPTLSLAQRTWVGLTDEDIQEVRENCGITHHAIKTIEAKLREKNA